MQEKLTERNHWVDHAKGIGIILVVHGHVVRGLVNAGLLTESPFLKMMDAVIYSFHMPLFFFLAGVFFLRSKGSRRAPVFVSNKVDAIVYPYVVWSLLQGTLEVGMGRFTNGTLSMNEVLQLFWAPRAQFWFLYALFLILMISLLLYRRSSPLNVWGVALLGLLVYVNGHRFPDTGRFWLVTVNFVFFAAGVCFSLYQVGISERARALLWPSLIAFVLAQWLYHGLWGMHYRMGGFQTVLIGVASIWFVIVWSMNATQRHWWWSRALTVLGAASMSIYLMHILASSGVRVLLSKMLHIQEPWLHVTAGVVLGVLLPWLVARAAPKLGYQWLFTPPKALSLEAQWRQSPRGT